MPKLKQPDYTVIRDTREKDEFGWIFPPSVSKKPGPKCLGTIRKKLENGDYSLKGYEDLVGIERKERLGEIWSNFSNRNDFEKKMFKLGKLKYSYLIIETNLSKDHFDLSPPQMTTSIPGKTIMSWLIKINIKYGVNIIFAGDAGRSYAYSIFREIIRQEKDKWIPT